MQLAYFCAIQNSLIYRRGVPALIPEPEAEPAPVPDLLGSILTGQSLLMMSGSDVVINRDGSLTAKKTGESKAFNSLIFYFSFILFILIHIATHFKNVVLGGVNKMYIAAKGKTKSRNQNNQKTDYMTHTHGAPGLSREPNLQGFVERQNSQGPSALQRDDILEGIGQ